MLTAVLLTFGNPLLAAQSAQPAVAAPPASSDYVFRSASGLLIFHVRPEQVQVFEAVIARLAQGLDAATDEVRRQQKAGWRVYRSTDTAAGGAVYVVIVEPAVPGADYDPVRMLAELLPGESQALYEQLRAAVVRVERMGLARVR